MIGRVLASYLAGWCVVLVVVLGVLTRFGNAWLGFDDPTTLIGGVATAAIVDLLVFSLIVCGLVRWPKNFFVLWGASELLKMIGFGGAAGWIATATTIPVRNFLFVAVIAFVAFTHHEVFALMRLAGKLERNRARATEARSDPGT